MSEQIIIHSSSNPKYKKILQLKQKKYRKLYGLYLFENEKMVIESIEKKYELDSIIINEEYYEKKYLKMNYGGNHELIVLNDKLFRNLSDTENSQGIIGCAKITNIEIDFNKIKNGKFIYLNKIQDPGNMGTIIRSADAFGFDGIFTDDECVDPYNSKVIRSSMGAIFRVPIINVSIDQLIELKKKNFKLIGTSLNGDKLEEFNLSKLINVVILIGNESKGLSNELIKITDNLLKISMLGQTESLNAAVAASIIMYRFNI